MAAGLAGHREEPAFTLSSGGSGGRSGSVRGKPQRPWAQREGLSGQADLVFAKIIKQQVFLGVRLGVPWV